MLIPQDHGRLIGRLLDYAKDAYLDQDPAVQRWIMGAAVCANSTMAKHLEKFLQIRAAEAKVQGRSFYQPRTFSSEGLHPSRVFGVGFAQQTRTPILRNVDSATTHINISGATGSGKSVLALLLQAQISKHANLIVVDRDKTDGRLLANFLDVVVVNLREFPWNPWQRHPHIPPDLAIASACAALSKSFGFMVASHTEVIGALHRLYHKKGVFQGSEDFPTTAEVITDVESLKYHPSSRRGQPKETLLGRLNSMRIEVPGLNYVKGVSIEEIANRHIVFEAGGVNEYTARFIIMHILITLFHYRQRSRPPDGKLRNFITIDEASWFAPLIKGDQVGLSLLDDLVSKSRSAGLGFAFASQSVSDLDPTILKNSEVKIIFRLGDGRCINRAAEAAALDMAQRSHIPMLGTGECIYQSPQMRPCLIDVPNAFEVS